MVRGNDQQLGAYFADKPGSYGDNGGSLKVKFVERSNITLTTVDGFGNATSAPTMLETRQLLATFPTLYMHAKGETVSTSTILQADTGQPVLTRKS